MNGEQEQMDQNNMEGDQIPQQEMIQPGMEDGQQIPMDGQQQMMDHQDMNHEQQMQMNQMDEQQMMEQ